MTILAKKTERAWYTQTNMTKAKLKSRHKRGSLPYRIGLMIECPMQRPSKISTSFQVPSNKQGKIKFVCKVTLKFQKYFQNLALGENETNMNMMNKNLPHHHVMSCLHPMQIIRLRKNVFTLCQCITTQAIIIGLQYY